MVPTGVSISVVVPTGVLEFSGLSSFCADGDIGDLELLDLSSSGVIGGFGDLVSQH